MICMARTFGAPVTEPGEKIAVAGYDVTFKGVAPRNGPNYEETVGTFAVSRNGSPVTTIEGAKRMYDAPKQATTEAGIHVSLFGDLYLVLGDETGDGAFAVRAYFNPLVRFIWVGCMVMAFGGLLSLTDRRLRVGAPKRRAVAAVPAE